MKKLFLLSLLLFCSLLFSQDKNYKLGLFTSLDANVGFDVASSIKTNQAQTQFEKDNIPPGKFSYGSNLLVGVQPLKWFSISGGLRYSYIDPNFHLLYYKIQPQVYVNKISDEDYTYLFANFGSKINHTAAKNANFIGLGFGMIEPIGKRYGRQFQVYLDGQTIDGNGTLFIGISYGIIIFSNKNL